MQKSRLRFFLKRLFEGSNNRVQQSGTASLMTPSTPLLSGNPGSGTTSK
jgi:hypothetical protein